MSKFGAALFASTLLLFTACQDTTDRSVSERPANDTVSQDDAGNTENRVPESSDVSSETSTRSLFNGTDLTGWHTDVPDADDNPDITSSFVVRDGLQVVSMGSPGGHLITDDVFENYRLEVEYRFANTPGNCGVLVHSSTPRALYDMFPASVEVQMNSGHAGDFWCIIENITVPDMASRRDGDPNTWTGDEGDNRRILNLTDNSESPVGEWNSMVIETVGNTIRVWVNGTLVNDGYDMTASSGQIALQAEGVEVEFRKVDLKPISELTPLNAVTSQ